MIQPWLSALNLLFQWLSTKPETVAAQHYRFFVAGNFIYLAGVLGHGFFIPMFLWMGSPAMALFNVASVILFGTVIRFNLKGYLKTGYFLAFAEVLTHSSLCLMAFGWDTGFNYYILFGTMLIFLFPWERLASRLIQLLLLAWLYLSLNYYTAQAVPFVPITPMQTLMLVTVNTITIMVTLALAGYYYSSAAANAEAALEAEYQRSEALLHNVLPETIAKRLKAKQEVIADYFDCTTILFSDIVGFTPLSETMSPEALVGLLNEIFSRFDALIDEYNLEKIKTIGDAYMVASGLPIEREDHAEAVANLALDMVQAVQRFNAETGQTFNIRIGLHSGSVIAGVIGRRKFIYDVWGDTVNTASRMESHGVAGKIQLTQATHELLKGKFEFEERGLIEVKGKGSMPTYFLTGRH